MMKSFFKKLSLVMALAMVVTMMAPAASAFAAEAGIAVQGTQTVVTEYDVEVGEEVVDFCFLGAPADWKTTYQWASDNEEVATVDKAGVVTTKQDGTATITITAGADASYKHSVVLTVGEEEVDLTAFEADMLSDNTAKLTFNDTSITAADLKNGLSFYYYVAADYPVYVPLVEKIEGKDGVFTATLYDGVTFQDGTVYGFLYNGVTDEFTCVIGTVAFAELTVNNKKEYLVEVSETEYTFGAKLYNEAGKDITATALASGVYVEYSVSEDEDGKYYPAGDTGILFDEPATATVKVSAYVLDEDGEPVTLVNALPYSVTAKNPAPYDIIFNQAPAFTIVEDADAVNWTKPLNSKIAVGDDGYELAVKITDNKNKAVATTEYYIGSNGLQDAAWEEGTFSFKSTNVSKLYVTEKGELMPNEKGNVTVLVYFTPVQTGEETPVAKIVAAINLNVQGARAVGETSLNVTNKTLSTVDVNGSNKTTVTLNVLDTLGDKTGVAGLTAKIELTTQAASLKNGATAPKLSATTATVADGKATFTITADNDTLPVASKSQTYSYKVTIGTKTETFTITVKSPASNTVFSKYSLIFGNAKVEDSTSVDNLKLTVGLAGISNGVAAAKLGLFDAKLKAEDAVAGNYYYVVTKDGVDITEKLTGAATQGTLSINLTTTKDVKIKETTTAEEETIKVVDATFGAGKYAVTAYEVKTDSKGNPYFKQLTGAKDTYTVENKFPTAAYGKKIAPEYVGTADDVVAAVKNCFKFTVGSTTFDEADDYEGYKIVINENVLSNGNVCYVNTVTFYKESKVDGVYIDCGTVTVGDYITFVAE